MCRTLMALLCASVCLPSSQAAEGRYDYRQILNEVSRNSDASPADKQLWRSYLDKASGVPIDKTREMFRDAAAEFNVPRVLLEAIGYLENNWIQVGPSIDRGWGIMHLVENDYCDTLGEAAELLRVDRQILKDDPRQNIRGAAALLAAYARQPVFPSDARTNAAPPSSLEDWFPAAARFSGLISRELRNQQARRYFSIIKRGARELNVLNNVVEVRPESVNISDIVQTGDSQPDGAAAAPDYPAAKAAFTRNNFNRGRNGIKTDTWVVHWMGVGTYAGAISWFHNPSANASAHFCIRNSDGEITQVVGVNDTAWHTGAPNGWSNNERSIGVEHEATATHPEWWNSEPMLNAAAKLTRFFCDRYGIQPEHHDGVHTGGIVGHKQMPGVVEYSNTDCPGPIPWDVLIGKILQNPQN